MMLTKNQAIRSLAAVGKTLIDFHKAHRYWQITTYVVEQDEIMKVEDAIRENLSAITKAIGKEQEL